MNRRHRDPVTPELRIAVLKRDQGCLAPRLDPHPGQCRGRLTLDHVQHGYGMMGRRAASDLGHLATVCEHHHLDGWATSHRPELRAYLRKINEPGGYLASVETAQTSRRNP